MLEKKNCKCGQQDFDLLTNQNMIINGPDIHQQIVNNYIQYSKKYWIDVKKRQLKYLANKRSNNITEQVNTIKPVAAEPAVFFEKPKKSVAEMAFKNTSCWPACITPKFK